MRALACASLALALLAVAGCAPEAEPGAEASTAEAQDNNELAKRLAFMAGHVEAGIALYRAGEGEAGGPHLLHPVSEAYAEEREGLDAIGFDPQPYESVSQALEEGRPAAEIEPQLEAVEANLAQMRERVGGAPDAVIAYLMELVAEEYAIGVSDGNGTDDGEYQDAWGFSRVARQIADGPATTNAEAVRAELDALVALWPDSAPVPPAEPASHEAVSAQVEKVLAALGTDEA